jgi:hypothetical protein
MVSVTKCMSGASIASSTRESYHLAAEISTVGAGPAVRPEALPALLHGPQPADGEPERVDAPDADEPQGRGEKAGQHVRRVVDAQVEAREADEEHHRGPDQHHRPARGAAQVVGQDQGERPVEADRDGGVAAGKRVEARRVPGVYDLGPRPPEDPLEHGRQEDAAGGRDHQHHGREPPAPEVEGEEKPGEERHHDHVVSQGRRRAHRAVHPGRDVRLDPEQDRPVERPALSLHNLLRDLGEAPHHEGRRRKPDRQPHGGGQRQPARHQPPQLPQGLRPSPEHKRDSITLAMPEAFIEDDRGPKNPVG